MIDEITAYAEDVVSGRIAAGKYHKLCCARHLRDIDRQTTSDFPFRLDYVRAERFFRFAGKLKHYKGRWAGECIHLEPWQQFITGSVIGWVHVETGLRRYRTAFHQIPRKNGKTLTAAIVLLYLTFFDGEPGAEGYSIATKRDQAKIVFTDAKKLVQSSGLRDRIKIQVGNLHRDETSSKLEPLGADHDSTDGLNPHVVVMDEMHAMKDRGMIDVIETATGARDQPTIYQITTFGSDPVSPWGDQNDYSQKILDRVLVDETFFVFTAHADIDDDWTLESTARKANPNFGISVNPGDLASKVVKAKSMPAASASYKQKHLNLLVNGNAPWLSLEGWRQGQTEWTWQSLRGRACWIGIDMSSKIDLTAVVLVFPPDDEDPRWRLLVWCLTPADTLDERARRDRAPYQTWVVPAVSLAEAGSGLRTNPGNRIDQDLVLEWVRVAAELFDVQQIGIDPWNAANLVKDLTDEGFVAVEIPQTLQQMSAPAKDFEADVLDGLIDAGGDPLMQWCVSNVVVIPDNKDNIYPSKKRSRGRIDPVVAALMARKLAAIDNAEQPADDPVLVVA